MNQTRHIAKAIQLTAAPDSRTVWLHYRVSDRECVSIELDPDLVGASIYNLMAFAGLSTNAEIRDVATRFAPRDVGVITMAGPLLVSTLELECGLKFTTTLDVTDAERLKGELQSGLDVVKNAGQGSRH